jgi:hypothetical protein
MHGNGGGSLPVKHVLVAVEMPQNQQQWIAFLTVSGTEHGGEHIRKISENVWQVDFEKSPTSFGQILYAMKQFGLPGKILPFVDGQQWLPVDSNP